MTDRTAIFWAKISLVVSAAGLTGALVGVAFRRSAFTFIGLFLTWVSMFMSFLQTERRLRKTQKQLVEALEENLALKEGNLRMRIGDPGDHDRKGILS